MTYSIFNLRLAVRVIKYFNWPYLRAMLWPQQKQYVYKLCQKRKEQISVRCSNKINSCLKSRYLKKLLKRTYTLNLLVLQKNITLASMWVHFISSNLSNSIKHSAVFLSNECEFKINVSIKNKFTPTNTLRQMFQCIYKRHSKKNISEVSFDW